MADATRAAFSEENAALSTDAGTTGFTKRKWLSNFS
jgi:hypothetical protein